MTPFIPRGSTLQFGYILALPDCRSLAGPPSQVLWRPWMRNLAQDLEGFAQVRVTSPHP